MFMWENFLPRLFFGKSKKVPPVLGYLSTLLVNKSGMGLQNPVTLETEKYNNLLRASYKIIGEVTGKKAFSANDRI